MNPHLENVQERIEAALSQIDNALVRRLSGDDVAGQLKILADEHTALRGRHREISNRLDAAISRLRRVLED